MQYRAVLNLDSAIDKEETGMTYTFKIGRDAETGRFISVVDAQNRKNTAIVETIKITKK